MLPASSFRRPASARRRRGRSRHLRPEPPRTEMTPMVDVSFLLLVFFMLTLQFKTLEGLLSAQLPRDAGLITCAEVTERIDLSIRVLREGTRLEVGGDGAWSGSGPYRHGPDRLIQWTVGPWATTDPVELQRRLNAVHRSEPDRTVSIDAWPGTVYAEAVQALDAVRLAGWTEVAFVGSRE